MSTAPPDSVRKKLVIVGDGAVFDNHVVDVFLDSQVIHLGLWDTAGQEEYARLRPLSYPATDCLLLCFAIDTPSSLTNVEDKWRQELLHYCPNVPFLLIGCKTDLRQDPDTIGVLAAKGQAPVTFQQGVYMAQKIKAWRYLECSAKLNEGVSDVFECATRAACFGTDGGAAQSTTSVRSSSQGTKKSKKNCIVM